MTFPTPARQRPQHWLLRLMAGCVLLLTAACANGDFGEVKPTLVSDNIHNWVGPAASGRDPSLFDLTDDERQLRDLAYPLVEPPYDRQRWYSISGEYGYRDEIGRSFDRTAYAANLLSSAYRSATARYAKLIEDIRNDTTRLPQFFETAARVADIDAKRRKSFAYIPTISEYELVNAKRRMKENAGIIAMVQASLHRRAQSYQFALERLVIITPSAQAVDAELELSRLKTTIASYGNGAPVARGQRVAFNP
jgi:hypothetical protein